MVYLTYERLLSFHVHMMRDLMQESFYGVLNERLLRSALARPQQAAQYENASGLRQAAYLFQGLLMNHGFAQGNKRSAFAALGWFLCVNKLGRMNCTLAERSSMCYAAENDKWTVDQLDAWLSKNVAP